MNPNSFTAVKKSPPSTTPDKTAKTLSEIGESATAANTGTEDEIRGRAYALYLAEGRPDGRDVEHWLAAEADCNATMKTGEAPGSGEAEMAELQSAKAPKKPTAAKPRTRKRAVA